MRFTRRLRLAALTACLALAASSAMAQSGTTLEVTNNSSQAIPVMITLGANFAISNVNQLPSSWTITPYGTDVTKGSFALAANSSVSFNSGAQSFSGNISFGPTFNNTGCGSTAANACYPNATVLAEFTLNIAGGTETVDISGVNGTNATITINFKGQTSSNQWNNGQGKNTNVSSIANAAIRDWKPVSGVYGWQATTCTGNSNPPNPLPACPAPVDAPSSSQLQTLAQCNIQRMPNAPTGGIAQIVFNSWTSQPPANCN